jgi:ParB-like chromosome segregation protein Spo0J
MPVSFKTNHKFIRTDAFYLDPADIHLDVENNGRHDLPDIAWLIGDIEKRGQLTPCLIRKDGERAVMVEGHSRWRAIVDINKRRKLEDRLKVLCTLFRGNEVDALIAGFSANRERNALTPVDEGYFVDRLLKYGKTLEEIAAITHEEVEWCKQRVALVSLTPEAQQAVSTGAVRVSTAAKTLAKMSADLQRKAVKDRDAKGRVTTKAIREASGKAAPVRVSLNKLRLELEPFANGERDDVNAQDLAKYILKILSGKTKL